MLSGWSSAKGARRASTSELDLFAPGIAHIGDGDELRFLDQKYLAEIVGAAGADADASEDDLVARRSSPGTLTQH